MTTATATNLEAIEVRRTEYHHVAWQWMNETISSYSLNGTEDRLNGFTDGKTLYVLATHRGFNYIALDSYDVATGAKLASVFDQNPSEDFENVDVMDMGPLEAVLFLSNYLA